MQPTLSEFVFEFLEISHGGLVVFRKVQHGLTLLSIACMQRIFREEDPRKGLLYCHK